MEKHTKNDVDIAEKRITTIENILNDHMEYWIGFTKAGEKITIWLHKDLVGYPLAREGVYA